jgi:Zn-dependent protease
MRLGRIFGTDIIIDQTWWIFMLIMFMMSSANGVVQGLLTVAALCLVFVCVLGHEFAHIGAGRLLGIRVPTIVLHIFGGAALFPVIPYGKREIQIAIAGPLFSLLLAGIFIPLSWLLPPDSLPYAAVHFLGVINLILGGFNLLPIFPMDGGRIFRGLLYIFNGQNAVTSTKWAVYTGWVIAPFAVYFCFGLNMWTIVILAFMGFLGYTELKAISRGGSDV